MYCSNTLKKFLVKLFFLIHMAYMVFIQKADNQGFRKTFTNRTVLADFTGISYNTLTDHFIRKKHIWHYYEKEDVTIISYDEPERGRQRVQFKQSGHNRNI